MHFYYVDEAGCNGRDLTNPEQPIFVAGGIIVRDEGWNQTNREFNEIISNYFNGLIPENFELHTCDLLSPTGDGFFTGHDRERRNGLVTRILSLIVDRRHQTVYIAIDKSNLRNYDITTITDIDHLDLKVPYLLAYDYLISLYDWYTREHLGRSARALIIIDEKEEFTNEIGQITQFRRYEAPRARLINRITEFSYAINSKKNPMVQISDMVCFLAKKYLEIETGYREEYSPEVKNIYRRFYRDIDQRLIRKTLLESSGLIPITYNQFMSNITAWPSRNWRSKTY